MMATSSFLASKIHGTLRHWFRQAGAIVACRPRTWMALSVVLCASIGAGMTSMDFEATYEDLWYPRNSRAWRDLQRNRHIFGYGDGYETIIARPLVADGRSVLTSTGLLYLLDLHDILMEISEPWHTSDVCTRSYIGAPCEVASVLSVWSFNRTLIAGRSDTELLADVITAGGQDGITISFVRDEASPGQPIVAADALQQVYSVALGDGGISGKVEEWEAAWLAVCHEHAAEGGAASAAGLLLTCYAQRSYKDESDRAIEDDMAMVQVAMILSIVYTTVILGRIDRVKSRALLSMSVVATVGLSILVSFGIAGLMQYPFTQLSMMSVFILLGIGIDDMFIVVHAFDRAEKRSRLRTEDATRISHLISEALSDVGPSITLTSITDALAFTLGSLIDIPAVETFCVQACIAICAVFVLQITLFTPALCLDVARVRARRVDICPCISIPERDDSSVSGALPGKTTEQGGSDEQNGRTSVVAPVAGEEGRNKGNEYCGSHGAAVAGFDSTETDDDVMAGDGPISSICAWSSQNLTPRLAFIVVLVFLALDTALFVHGAIHVKKGADWSDFLPSGSYVLDHYDAREASFGEIVSVTFSSDNSALGRDSSASRVSDRGVFDPDEPDDLERWQAFVGAATSLPETLTAADDVSLWPNAYAAWLGGTNSSRSLFTQWRAGPAAATASSRDMVGSGAVLSAARFTVWVRDGDSIEAKTRLKDRMRATADTNAPIQGLSATAYGSDYPWLERYDRIDGFTLQSIAAALGGVALVNFFFMPPGAAILVTVVVALVNADILGIMVLSNISLNVASLVNLVLAIGFSVDYSAHVAEGIATRRIMGRDSSVAVRSAMIERGASVLCGGSSTLVAVLVLAFSRSTGFQTLFKMFLGMVIFGLAHGLVFLPCVYMLVSFSVRTMPSLGALTSKKASKFEVTFPAVKS